MDDTIAELVSQPMGHAVVALQFFSSKIAIVNPLIAVKVMVDPLKTSSELEARQTLYRAVPRKDQVLSYAKL